MITDHCCHCAGVDLTGAGWKCPCLCRSSAGIAHRAPATGDQSTVTPATRDTRDTRGMQTRARVRLPCLLWHKLQKRLLNVVHTRYIWKPRILTSHLSPRRSAQPNITKFRFRYRDPVAHGLGIASTALVIVLCGPQFSAML